MRLSYLSIDIEGYMTHTYQISGMTCSGCATTVEEALKKTEGVEAVRVDRQQETATITMSHHIPTQKLQDALKAYPSYQLNNLNHHHTTKDHHSPVHTHESGPSDDGGQYYCPMLCEGDKKYSKPGNCPVCGMHLVKEQK